MKKIEKNSKYYEKVSIAWTVAELTSLGIEITGLVKKNPYVMLAGYAGVIATYFGAQAAMNKWSNALFEEKQAAVKKATEDLMMATAEFYEEPKDSEATSTEAQWQA